MARLLILTDRDGDDADWKGTLVWRIIKSLAEAQHEVVVACTVDFDDPPVSHPRLSVIRPVNSWRIDQLPKLMKAILTFQPQVIQTFAIQDRGLWPKLSLWPYFSAVCAVMPGLKRVSTIFDNEDVGSMLENWNKQASTVAMFSQTFAQEMSGTLGRLADVLPLDLPLEIAGGAPALDVAVIPSSVSDWEFPEQNLIHVRDLLHRYPQTTVKIIGGWGIWSASQKREGWKILESVAARVQMREPMAFDPFLREIEDAREFWLEPVRRNSWRFLLCTQIARQLGKKVLMGTPLKYEMPLGSTANSLSRIYST